MIIKIAGLFMVFLSCASAGISMAFLLKERVRVIYRLVQMLEALKEELTYNQAPIRQALIRIIPLSEGAARDFLDRVNSSIAQGEPPPDAWAEAAKALRAADEGDRLELASFSGIIGGSDIAGQRAAIDNLIRALNARKTEAEERRDSHARIYKTLGYLAGAAAVVIAF